MRSLLVALLLVVLGLVLLERHIPARPAAPSPGGAPAAEGGNGMPSCPPCRV